MLQLILAIEKQRLLPSFTSNTRSWQIVVILIVVSGKYKSQENDQNFTWV